MQDFFDTVRPMFRKLTVSQVAGTERIVAYAAKRDIPRAHCAYMLATIFHETARWMEPIREGARRYGPTYTDASARRAVATIYAKGIISHNYAKPNKAGHSFYGRGLVQITHEDNYIRLGEQLGVNLAATPDLALDWDNSLDITFVGSTCGLFTGKKLKDFETAQGYDFYNARSIINGDKRKNGKNIADNAKTFELALSRVNYGDKPTDQLEEKQDVATKGRRRPDWWPF